MPAAEGEIHVYTFKEGVLSHIAHDLRLTLERFRVRFEQETLSATFETDSLRVDGVMRTGELDPQGLDAGQRREIEHTLRTVILKTRRYPSARLEARADPGTRVNDAVFSVSGELELAGERRSLSFDVRREGAGFQTEIELVPSQWGIRPYRALLGAIRLQDRVRVVARLTPSND